MSKIFEDFYLKVELIHKNAKVPERGTSESAGLDFFTPEPVCVKAKSKAVIPLGIRVEMPPGYVLFFENKSGIATKRDLVRGANVIDSDYRGEPHAHIINNTDKDQYFDVGDKVIQGIVFPVWLGLPQVVDKVNMETDRGEGGFGSTGK